MDIQRFTRMVTSITCNMLNILYILDTTYMGCYSGDLGFKVVSSLKMTKSTVYQDTYRVTFNPELCESACDHSRFIGVVCRIHRLSTVDYNYKLNKGKA